MAKILFSAFMSDARNKLNGSVFSKNRYGSFIRNKVSPTNAQTAFQTAARSLLAFFSANWRTLTDAQQQGWINGSINFPFTDVFGNTRSLSGQSLYVKLNCNLNLIGKSAIDDCPTPAGLPIVVIADVTANSTTNAFDIDITGSDTPVGFFLLVYATPAVSNGRNYVKGLYKLLGVGTPVLDIVDIASLYSARYPPLAVGQKIFVKLVVVSGTTGQASPPLTSFVLVG